MKRPVDQRLRDILASERERDREWAQKEATRRTEEAERQKYEASLPGNQLRAEARALQSRMLELDRRHLKQYSAARFINRVLGRSLYPIERREGYIGTAQYESLLKLATPVLLKSKPVQSDNLTVKEGWVFRMEAPRERQGITVTIGWTPDRFWESGSVDWSVPLQINRAILDTESGHVTTVPVYEIDPSNNLTDCPVVSHISDSESQDPLLPSGMDVTEHALTLVRGAIREL